MNCPSCKEPTFVTKEYEMEQIDICTSCYGVWLDQGEISKIIENKVTEFTPEEIKKTVSNAFMGIPLSEKETKVHCPKCNVEMHPVNYTVDSGVIIDKCPNDHGVWLDKNELEKVQQYRDYWQEKSFQNKEQITSLIRNTPRTQQESSSFLFGISVAAAEIWENIVEKLK